MLLTLLRTGLNTTNLISVLLTIPCVLFALTIHECSHGLVACWMGDKTARNLGRLTLNPSKHLDLIGTIMMLLCGFGWAKPVPINSRNFKNHKWGTVIVALAGPISNLINAFISILIYCLVYKIFAVNLLFYSNLIDIILTLLYINAFLNISLALFNLIPIPPLDGSRVLFAFLPAKYYFQIMQYERYFSYALILLIAFGSFSNFISYAANGIFELFLRFGALIFGL